MKKYDVDGYDGYMIELKDGEYYKTEDVDKVLSICAERMAKVDTCPFCINYICVKGLNEEEVENCKLDGTECFLKYLKDF